MALGAITQNPSNHISGVGGVGDLKVTSTDVVGDSSYPTGGTALTPAQLGLNAVIFAVTSIKITGAVGAPNEAYYNPTTQRLLVYTTGGEMANTTVLSATTFQIVAFGY